MSEMKELNQEELEKVTGGATGTAERIDCLSGPVTPDQSYQYAGENLFFFHPTTNDLIYGKLLKCWELAQGCGKASCTQYDVEIKESSMSDSDSWVPGNTRTLASSDFTVYTSYSGTRPICYVDY